MFIFNSILTHGASCYGAGCAQIVIHMFFKVTHLLQDVANIYQQIIGVPLKKTS
jgi:hypothetical protein